MNINGKFLFFLTLLCILTPIAGKLTIDIECVTLFSHGIGDTFKQANKYVKSYDNDGIICRNDRYLIHTPYVSFNYPDATEKFYRVEYGETSFGQENEIGRLKKAYAATTSRYENCNIILYGLSRGASNVCIFAALHQLDNVKALVLESPYYSMGEVIANIMRTRNFDQWFDISWGQWLAEFIFKKYSRHGWSPENCVEHIPKEMPILIICSQEDSLVPAASSINVYKKLIESGHQHTYIFITEHGKHAAILQGADGEKYQCVANAFYKKYNLPHCAVSAARGESLLAACQPEFS